MPRGTRRHPAQSIIDATDMPASVSRHHAPPGAALMATLDDLQRSTALDAAATAALRAELAHERSRRVAAERAAEAAAAQRDAAVLAASELELKLASVEEETAALAQQLHALLFCGDAVPYGQQR